MVQAKNGSTKTVRPKTRGKESEMATEDTGNKKSVWHWITLALMFAAFVAVVLS
jgi:hypothetical protein